MTADIRAQPVTIAELDPDDPAAVDAAWEVQRAATAHDVPDFPAPCRYGFRARQHFSPPGERIHRWIARDGAAVVGYLEVSLPILDNLDNAFVELMVVPDHRRRGIGRALYEQALTFVRAEGRRRIMAFTATALPGGEPRDAAGSRFAESLGMQSALDEVRRRLDLTTVDPHLLDRLLADAWTKADGYSMVQWSDRVPDDCVDDVGRLDSDFINEAPKGDLELEAEKVDAARIRAGERARAEYGVGKYSTAMRHDATGRVVALSDMFNSHDHHEHASQGITLVHPAHRGHRLGLIAKIENLRLTRREMPGVRYVDTWNAAVNEHMIAINEAMGFRPVEVWHNWQQDI